MEGVGNQQGVESMKQDQEFKCPVCGHGYSGYKAGETWCRGSPAYDPIHDPVKVVPKPTKMVDLPGPYWR